MNENKYNEFDIAVIGMACRFPGADNPMEFWQNLIIGKESIKRLSDEEMIEAGVDPSYLDNSLYVKASPVLNNPGYFDASFFGFTPAEALALDPQHRILLTCAYEALENAGYDPDKYNGRIGVYTGSAMNTYLLSTGLREKFVDEYIPTLIGNDKDFLSTRLSYKLNLKGPSINVQTACSTSLVAVHLACQSILNGENDMAIAGAVSVKAPHYAGYIFDRGGIVSPDGHVRAFDANANGTVFGSGAGIIILKKLTGALNDRDNILAVIKASAVNNDGSEKAGYTAPGIRSQADVVIEAILNSGINAEEISYIETHGSGTPVGDPIEIAALTKAFRKFTHKKNYCAIGSVKTNIGHLDAAAGIAGIIKTILCLTNKRIPASLNYSKPNPEISFADSPFYVNTKLREWESSLKIAGVMSTGMGGTNAYVILQEAPELKDSKSLSPGLIVFSAKNETALDKQSELFSDYLQNQGEGLKNIAYTLQVGRKEFEYRRFFVAENNKEAAELLIQNNSKRIFSGRVHSNIKRPVIFLFPGVGDHYVGMGYELYNNIKFFKKTIDHCADILKNYINVNIKDIIYPEAFHRSPENFNEGIDLKKMLAVSNSHDPDTGKLNQTIYSQPALFIIEYALAKLWMHLGIIPDALIGHSMGEYVAACLAGVFSLEEALKMITIRARLVNNLPGGSMLAITLSEKELIPLLNDNISISLINSPNLCVVAGSVKEIDKFKDILISKGILYRSVQNTHAFHSKMMAPVLNEFIKEISKVKLNSPQIPYTSNVTGEWISENEATDPMYWGNHLINTARFSNSVEKAWQIDNSVLLEVGPGNTLSVLAMQHPSRNRRNNPVTISSLRPVYDNQSDIKFLFTSIGRLWLSGININWEKLYEEENPPRRIPLPAYPFQYENYWLKNKIDITTGNITVSRRINNFKDWFYTPVWIRKNFSKGSALTFEGKKLWVTFQDELGLGVQIKNYLENNNQTVISVKSGLSYYENNNDYVIDIRNPADYINLFKKLKSIDAEEINIIHLGCYSDQNDSWFDYKNDNIQHLGFYSLLYITQSLSRANFSIPIKIGLISNHIHLVTGNEVLCPKKALVLGLCGVIPKEFPNIKCFNVDLTPVESEYNSNQEIVKNLVAEFDEAAAGANLAYRGNFRWIKEYNNINLLPGNKGSGSGRHKILKDKGVYLITGGTGGIGLTIAKYLAENFHARLILTQISEIPPKIKWREIIKGNHIDNILSQKIRKLIEIEESGGVVNVYSAPVSDKIKMKEIINSAIAEFGELNGMIHCAGIVRPGIISAKEKETIDQVFLPKVEGTLLLNELVKDMKLDFFVICSSITSVITPFAESDYSAANAFIDAFAQYSNSFNKVHTLSINWPGWKEVGQLANLEMLKGTEQWKKTALEKAISPQEGLEAFKLALNSDFDQIIVSPEPLENSDSIHSVPEAENIISQNKIDEEISKEVNGTNVEENLSLIWKDILGVMKSDNDDNFFEAGGHSLLAIQLISAIRKTFQVDLSIEDILDAATFSAICRKIYELRSMKNITK